jgi:hypothetical protein
MKQLIISLIFLVPLLMAGCCADDLCNVDATLTSTRSCSACNTCTTCSTCNTCGYDSSYTYSSWY